MLIKTILAWLLRMTEKAFKKIDEGRRGEKCSSSTKCVSYLLWKFGLLIAEGKKKRKKNIYKKNVSEFEDEWPNVWKEKWGA